MVLFTDSTFDNSLVSWSLDFVKSRLFLLKKKMEITCKILLNQAALDIDMFLAVSCSIGGAEHEYFNIHKWFEI